MAIVYYPKSSLMYRRDTTSSSFEQIVLSTYPNSVIYFGSGSELNEITASNWSITSSWSDSSSYSITASYALNGGGGSGGTSLETGSTYPITSSWSISSSWAPPVPSDSSSYSLFSVSASYAMTASRSENAVSASYAPSTGGTSLETGSSYPITSSWAVTAVNVLGSIESASYAATASLLIGSVESASYAPVEPAFSSSVSAVKQNTLITGGDYSITSSWSENAVSASYAPGGSGTSLGTGSSYPITSSWAENSISASWAPSTGGGGTTITTGSTYPITSSWATNATTATTVTTPNPGTGTNNNIPVWINNTLSSTSSIVLSGSSLVQIFSPETALGIEITGSSPSYRLKHGTNLARIGLAGQIQSYTPSANIGDLVIRSDNGRIIFSCGASTTLRDNLLLTSSLSTFFGSVIAPSITGSLLGTASWATNAVSSFSSSYPWREIGGNFLLGGTTPTITVNPDLTNTFILNTPSIAGGTQLVGSSPSYRISQSAGAGVFYQAIFGLAGTNEHYSLGARAGDTIFRTSPGRMLFSFITPSGTPVTETLIMSKNLSQFTGSVVAPSITGSLLGNATTATTATNWNSASVITLIGTKQNTLGTGSTYPITASWAINATSASWAPGGSGTTLVTGSTYPITSSWAINAVSSFSSSYPWRLSGGNFVIGGSSPIVTINTSSVFTVDVRSTTQHGGVRVTGSSPAYRLADRTYNSVIGLAGESGVYSLNSVQGDMVLRADTGRTIFSVGSGLSTTDTLVIAKSLAAFSGSVIVLGHGAFTGSVGVTPTVQFGGIKIMGLSPSYRLVDGAYNSMIGLANASGQYSLNALAGDMVLRNESGRTIFSLGVNPNITDNLVLSRSLSTFSGSLNVIGGVTARSYTGSLQGTSSWATNVVSGTGTSLTTGSTYPITSSWAISSSYALSSSSTITSSYALNYNKIPYSSITGSYSLSNSDYLIYANASSGSIVLTMPDASSVPEQIFKIKKIDSTGYEVIISSSVNIDYDTELRLSQRGSSVTLHSDSTQYWIH